jgi:hypothetical protein
MVAAGHKVRGILGVLQSKGIKPEEYREVLSIMFWIPLVWSFPPNPLVYS